jgi:hypothetical protein
MHVEDAMFGLYLFFGQLIQVYDEFALMLRLYVPIPQLMQYVAEVIFE